MSRAFATVGTTQFDALTSTLLSRELLETLRRQGYGELLVQYGRGAEPAPPTQPLPTTLRLGSGPLPDRGSAVSPQL